MSRIRPIFISHAVADAEIVNAFVDTLLIAGIGIGHENIFNVSAKSSPIPAGNNFSPEIREAIKNCKVVIAIVTPIYLHRPFTMAELGAAWSLDKLIPILVPPIDFNNLEGVLAGVQCIRITDKGKLHELYDRFDSDDLNKDRWFKRAGSATFNEHLAKFSNEYPGKLPNTLPTPKTDSPLQHQSEPQSESSSKTITPPPPQTLPPSDFTTQGAPPQSATTATRAPQPTTPQQTTPKSAATATTPKRTIKEESTEFNRLLRSLKKALSSLPGEVAIAHMYFATRDDWCRAAKDLEETVRSSADRGLLITRDFISAGNETGVLFTPSQTSQLNRDVFDAISSINEFLASASPEFHRSYEKKKSHTASTGQDDFWFENDVLPDKARDLYLDEKVN